MSLNYCMENITKWKLNELSNIVYEFENRVSDRFNVLKLKVAKDYTNILFGIAGKSIVTMCEIICLSSMGYPDGALSLARNLYEQLIIISFFEKHKNDSNFQEYIDDFFLDYNIQRDNALLYGVKGIKNNSELQNDLESKKSESKAKAHHKGNGDYWWTGKKNFKELVQDIQDSQSDEKVRRFLLHMHLIYKRACISLHANCMGNTIRLGIKPEFVGIDTRPVTDGHSPPLYLATSSFLFVSEAICNELEIEYKDIINRLNELASFFYECLLERK